MGSCICDIVLSLAENREHCLELSGEQRTYIMVLCCCGNKNDQVDDPEDEGGGPEGGEVGENSAQPSLNQMFYSRLGRVEKFKHGSTVMFLGKSVVLSVLILVLVQFIANTEVCYLHTQMTNLPDSVQKILAGKSSTNALRCPYDENYDVTYTFNHVADADGNNETDTENVTAIKVNMADIVVKKHSDGPDVETVMKTCGKLCSVKSCKCFTKMIWSDSCYIDFYEYGLQVDTVNDTEPKKGVFSIYFVVMVLIIVLLVLIFGLYTIVNKCCHKKRLGSSDN